tara:strand:+ start:1624 stop:2103 length:480 start_codon:yes stop_codon:yes gene_type:complete
MAFLSQSFDVSELPQASKDYSVLPAGWYSATISGAEVKETKAGTGEYIAVKYSITGPTHQGRVIFGNLNIKNPNPKAEEIGRQQLGDIMRAIGLARVTDTDQLIGGSLVIKLDVKEDEKYGERNEVKGFKADSGAVSSLPTAASSAQSGAKAAPPWAKK